jgi:tRNA pseudouridine32 synthase/23S rRNA pseudouridine746 synthase
MNVLFQDARFVVLDKPAGLKVHPGPGGGPSVEDFFPLFSRRRDGPWLVHRLDADTAGCLVIALRHAALLAAQAEFAAGRAEKTYWAVVVGNLRAEFGTIDLKLRKQQAKSGWRMVVDQGGDTAITDWRVLGQQDGKTWLELRPRTGRTHQIRAHCAASGYPILGDPIYATAGGDVLNLLARAITLKLDPPVVAVAPVPPHMAALSSFHRNSAE